MTETTITLRPADRVRLREVVRLLGELTERHDGESCACNLCFALSIASASAGELGGWEVDRVRLAEAH
jgi:hypothetical protein